MMKKIVSAALMVAMLQLGLTQDAQAQRRSSSSSASSGSYYNNALGMRVEFGTGFGLVGFSGKHFFTQNHAGEAALLFGTGVTVVDLEYQFHKPIGGAEGLQWYAGFGAAIGFGGGSTAFWMRPIGGLDYKIANAPINLSFDWRPTILVSDAGGGDRFTAGRFGLAARYAF